MPVWLSTSLSSLYNINWEADYTINCPALNVKKDLDWYPNSIMEYNWKSYFRWSTEIYWEELWMTDWSEQWTKMVKDINVWRNSGFDKMTVFKWKMYFVWNDWIHWKELWESDGTEKWTKILKDINSWAWDWMVVEEMFIYNNKLLFYWNDWAHWTEPWVTDWTENWTIMLKDINTWAWDSNIPWSSIFAITSKKALFWWKNSSDFENIYATDWTPEWTLMVNNSAYRYNFPTLTAFWDKVYVSCYVLPDNNPIWLCVWNESSVNMITSAYGEPTYIHTNKSWVYFTNYASIFKIRPDDSWVDKIVDNWVSDFIIDGNLIFFATYNPGTAIYSIYKVDISSESPSSSIVMTADANASEQLQIPFKVWQKYFASINIGWLWWELYSFDWSDFNLVKDINPDGDWDINMMTYSDWKYFFSVNDWEHWRELYVIDSLGVRMVKDINNCTWL